MFYLITKKSSKMTTFTTSLNKPNSRFTLSHKALRYLKILFSLSMGFENYADIDEIYTDAKLYIPKLICESTEEIEKRSNQYKIIYEELYDNIKNRILSYENKDTESILYKIFFIFDKEKNRNEDVRVIYSSEIRCIITLYNITIKQFNDNIYYIYYQGVYPFIQYLEAHVNDVLYY